MQLITPEIPPMKENSGRDAPARRGILRTSSHESAITNKPARRARTQRERTRRPVDATLRAAREGRQQSLGEIDIGRIEIPTSSEEQQKQVEQQRPRRARPQQAVSNRPNREGRKGPPKRGMANNSLESLEKFKLDNDQSTEEEEQQQQQNGKEDKMKRNISWSTDEEILEIENVRTYSDELYYTNGDLSRFAMEALNDAIEFD